MNKGYNFYFKIGSELLIFPITPGELTIKSGSNNEVINLINEGDINILKYPSLLEIEFEARFPMRQYPYAREFVDFQTYFDVFKDLKENKKSFRFLVTRSKPNGELIWDTNYLVSLEDMEMKESADEGDDVIINFKLKQYKEYSVTIIKKPSKNPTTTSTSTTPRPTETKTETESKNKSYTVVKGDCLWNIAKKFYGKGSEHMKIYNANKTVIEETAKKYGKASSSNGWWIYPGTKLTIPMS